MAFADGNRRQDVQKFVQDLCRGLRGTCPEALAQPVGTGIGQNASGAGFGNGTESADGERSAKDLCVVVVDLVLQPDVARLVEPVELVEAHGVAVGHDKSMEEYGKPGGSGGFDLACFTEKAAPSGNQELLAVMGIGIGGGEAFDGAGEGPVETVEENGLKNRSFKE